MLYNKKSLCKKLYFTITTDSSDSKDTVLDLYRFTLAEKSVPAEKKRRVHSKELKGKTLNQIFGSTTGSTVHVYSHTFFEEQCDRKNQNAEHSANEDETAFEISM